MPLLPCALDSLPFAGELPDSPWLLDWDSLPDWDWDWLLELLDEELLLELLELLLDGLLLLGGGVELGGVGVCGVVGVLALGHPLSSRQAQVSPPTLRSNLCIALVDIIGPDKFFRLYWLSRIKPRSKRCFTQLAHQAVGRSVTALAFIQALQVYHASAVTDSEF